MRIAPLIILLLLLTAQASAEAVNHYQCQLLLVDKASVILPNDEASSANLQLHVTNHHDQTARVVAVYTPVAKRAQLDSSASEVSPWPTNGLAINRHTTSKLENETAIKLTGLSSLHKQDPVPIVLLCDDGSHKLVKARVHIAEQCEDQACD